MALSLNLLGGGYEVKFSEVGMASIFYQILLKKPFPLGTLLLLSDPNRLAESTSRGGRREQ
jgi:hypothetical protein